MSEVNEVGEVNSCENTAQMTDWIKEESDVCRACILGPVIQWYQSELEAKGQKEMVTRLQAAIDESDEGGVRVCEELDRIKDEVDEELHARLREFDCAVQTHASQLSEDLGVD